MDLDREPAVGIEPTTARLQSIPAARNSAARPSIAPAIYRRKWRESAEIETRTANERPTCSRCGVVGVEHFGTRTKRGKVSRQPYCRPCMVAYHREWRATAEGRQKMRDGVSKSRARYPEKEAARYELRKALLRGDVVPLPCYVEGCTDATEAHHADYSKPLDVTWTCRAHHRALDRQRRAS